MAVDYLRQLVEDYNAGRVTLGDTLNRLEFLDWSENKKPLPDDYAKVPRDPADILVAKERQEALQGFLVKFRERLSDDNWRVIVMVSQGLTYEEIGKRLGISQPAVSKRLKTIRKYAEGLDELLRQDSPVYEAGSPVIKVAYPMDAAMGNQRKCRVPEYLAESFGDDKTCCCYCEKCKYKP